MLLAQLNAYVTDETEMFDLSEDGRITGRDVAAWKKLWKDAGRAK